MCFEIAACMMLVSSHKRCCFVNSVARGVKMMLLVDLAELALLACVILTSVKIQNYLAVIMPFVVLHLVPTIMKLCGSLVYLCSLLSGCSRRDLVIRRKNKRQSIRTRVSNLTKSHPYAQIIYHIRFYSFFITLGLIAVQVAFNYIMTRFEFVYNNLQMGLC